MDTQTTETTDNVMTAAPQPTDQAKPEAKPEQIARQPKKNCRHCYGRGHMGKNSITGLYVPCYCLEDPEHKKARVAQEDLARRFGRK